MKRKIRYGILAAAVSSLLAGCVKLREDVTEERIQKPHFDVEIPPPPAWEQDEGTDDLPIGK